MAVCRYIENNESHLIKKAMSNFVVSVEICLQLEFSFFADFDLVQRIKAKFLDAMNTAVHKGMICQFSILAIYYCHSIASAKIKTCTSYLDAVI